LRRPRAAAKEEGRRPFRSALGPPKGAKGRRWPPPEEPFRKRPTAPPSGTPGNDPELRGHGTVAGEGFRRHGERNPKVSSLTFFRRRRRPSAPPAGETFGHRHPLPMDGTATPLRILGPKAPKGTPDTQTRRGAAAAPFWGGEPPAAPGGPPPFFRKGAAPPRALRRPKPPPQTRRHRPLRPPQRPGHG